MTEAGITLNKKIKGKKVMYVNVTLNGGEDGRKETRDRGEVWVDPGLVLPRRYEQPLCNLDLSNKTITAAVSIPELPKGNPNGPNNNEPIFMQLFIERCIQGQVLRTDSPQYFITMQGTPCLKLEVGPYGTQICKIGVKISLSGGDFNSYNEKTIYIDAIDW